MVNLDSISEDPQNVILALYYFFQLHGYMRLNGLKSGSHTDVLSESERTELVKNDKLQISFREEVKTELNNIYKRNGTDYRKYNKAVDYFVYTEDEAKILLNMSNNVFTKNINLWKFRSKVNNTKGIISPILHWEDTSSLGIIRELIMFIQTKVGEDKKEGANAIVYSDKIKDYYKAQKPGYTSLDTPYIQNKFKFKPESKNFIYLDLLLKVLPTIVAEETTDLKVSPTIATETIAEETIAEETADLKKLETIAEETEETNAGGKTRKKSIRKTKKSRRKTRTSSKKSRKFKKSFHKRK
jgi:hypothetical protein